MLSMMFGIILSVLLLIFLWSALEHYQEKRKK